MKIYTMPVGTMGTNCYIAADGDVCAVIDPGFQAEKLISFLRGQKLRPEYILLTHGHYDHIGAVRARATHSAASWRSDAATRRCWPTAKKVWRSCAA